MLKYYLDKTGKVIKSILFPSSEFVDTEPREGSMNPVTSGGVAGSVSQQSSNFAPNYTKKTYEANSYVMQDGVLYTNPNAIETAEDWNPAHWTQTTVAEMMAGAQKKYVSVTKTATYDSGNKQYAIDVNQKEVITVTLSTSSISEHSKLYLNLGTTDDALIIVKKPGIYSQRLEDIVYSRQMSQIIHKVVQRVDVTGMDYGVTSRILLTDEWEEQHGTDYPVIPTDVSNTTLLSYAVDDASIITGVTGMVTSIKYDTLWMIRVIGDTALVATNENDF